MNIVKVKSLQKPSFYNKYKFIFENIFSIPKYNFFFSKLYYFRDCNDIIIYFGNKLHIFIETNNNIEKKVLNILSLNKFKSLDSIIIKHYDDKFNSIELNEKFNLIRDYRTMYINLDKVFDINLLEQRDFNIMVLDHNNENDIYLRIFLQNNIFNNKNLFRKPIDKQYIIREIYHESFMNDYCYCFKFNNSPIGYGQIIKEKRKYYLVNFGILQEHRGKGYGKIFLKYILNDLYKKEIINELFLNVDNNNFSAINLYKSVGFMSLINTIQIKLE